MKTYLIKYGNLKYNNLNPQIEEVGYPFQTFGRDINKNPLLPYSLHTEYSASKLNDNTIEQLHKYNFITLASALKAKKSQLWYSEKWTYEFIDFIKFIVTNKLNNKIPKIIEIHPPYIKNRNYQESLTEFFNYYKIFEDNIHKIYSSDIIILIENRNQSGSFLLSKSSDYIEFQKKIIEQNLSLKLIVDIPQLYGKMIRTYKTLTKQEIIRQIFDDLSQCKDVIGGFHICGKSHLGDFDTLFEDKKEYFLILLKRLVDNINNNLYVVPEIMRQSDFENIINDIKKYQIFNFN